jgi:hypothetical protein
MVQLNGGYFGDPLNFLGISERLTGQRIASIEQPPAFLLIEPTRPSRSAFGMKSLSSLVAQLWVGDRRPFRAAESTPLILIENGEILSQLLVTCKNFTISSVEKCVGGDKLRTYRGRVLSYPRDFCLCLRLHANLASASSTIHPNCAPNYCVYSYSPVNGGFTIFSTR